MLPGRTSRPAPTAGSLVRGRSFASAARSRQRRLLALGAFPCGPPRSYCNLYCNPVSSGPSCTHQSSPLTVPEGRTTHLWLRRVRVRSPSVTPEERANETLKTRSRVTINAIDNAMLLCPLALAETRFPRADDRMCSVRHLQLGEDVGDVVAYRLRAEGELPGDGGIGVALGDEAQDLALTVREGGVGSGWGAALR